MPKMKQSWAQSCPPLCPNQLPRLHNQRERERNRFVAEFHFNYNGIRNANEKLIEQGMGEGEKREWYGGAAEVFSNLNPTLINIRAIASDFLSFWITFSVYTTLTSSLSLSPVPHALAATDPDPFFLSLSASGHAFLFFNFLLTFPFRFSGIIFAHATVFFFSLCILC